MTRPVIVIIGAGPAGARAAEGLARAGYRPLVFDESAAPGGQIYRQPPAAKRRPPEKLYGFEASKAVSVHQVFSNRVLGIDYRPETLIWNIAGNRIDYAGPRGMASLRFDRLILATGAMDHAFPFPGWTLPGVFTLGAAQVALKAQNVAIGRRVVLVGAGPLLPLVGYQYVKAGADVAALLDLTPFAAKITAAPLMASDPKTMLKGLYYMGYASMRGIRSSYGVRSVEAFGDRRVEGLRWTDAGGRSMETACDAVGASIGLRSETQLAQLAGCAMTFDVRSRQYLPIKPSSGRTSREDVFVAGDGSGIAGADVAELAGERAALQVLETLGVAPSPRRGVVDRALVGKDRFRRGVEQAYPLPAHVFERLEDAVPLCRCENMPVGRRPAFARPRRNVRPGCRTRLGIGCSIHPPAPRAARCGGR